MYTRSFGIFVILCLVTNAYCENALIAYCPGSVKCYKNGSLNQCQTDDNQNIWYMIRGTKEKSGIYKLVDVSAYSWSKTADESKYFECKYSHDADTITYASSAKFYADVSGQSKWTFANRHWSCRSENFKDCPFVADNSILSAMKFSDGYLYFANFENRAMKRPRIEYDFLLEQENCQSYPICNYQIYWSNYPDSPSNFGSQIGNIRLDVSSQNEIKIVDIETKNDAVCKLTQSKPFNVISLYCARKKSGGVK